MAIEGYIDGSDAHHVRGWVFDNTLPNTPLNIEVLDGVDVLARLTAGEFRADLLAAGKGNGEHGFSFSAPVQANEPLSVRVAGKRWTIPPSGGYKTSHLLPMRFDATLAHSLEYGIPSAHVQQGFSEPITVGDDTDLATRLIRAYKATVKQSNAGPERKSDQWTEVEASYHQQILSLLKREDSLGLQAYLQYAHEKGITQGITQGELTTGELRKRDDARRLVMLATLDHLTSLAEFVGVLDVECADQHGKWGENIHRDPAEIIELIYAAAGIHPVPPQVIGGSFGILTGHGVISTRDLLALYAALRVKALVVGTGISAQSRSVCEIGGGLGGVAYFANRLGIAQYTIVDLPLVSLLQGYYLSRSLPGVKIQFYGEDVPDAAIRLVPTFHFSEASQKYDLLLNQDSMPEMHPDYARGYLRDAAKKKIPAFLSINQEARALQNGIVPQTAVRELVAETGGYSAKYRFRHWLRMGYVEELFELAPSLATDSSAG